LNCVADQLARSASAVWIPLWNSCEPRAEVAQSGVEAKGAANAAAKAAAKAAARAAAAKADGGAAAAKVEAKVEDEAVPVAEAAGEDGLRRTSLGS
jgi:hypothetical protein